MPSIAEINLTRLEKSALPADFVRQHNGEWDHQAWLDFCALIEDKGFTPVDLDKVGLVLEKFKIAYRNGTLPQAGV